MTSASLEDICCWQFVTLHIFCISLSCHLIILIVNLIISFLTVSILIVGVIFASLNELLLLVFIIAIAKMTRTHMLFVCHWALHFTLVRYFSLVYCIPKWLYIYWPLQFIHSMKLSQFAINYILLWINQIWVILVLIFIGVCKEIDVLRVFESPVIVGTDLVDIHALRNMWKLLRVVVHIIVTLSPLVCIRCFQWNDVCEVGANLLTCCGITWLIRFDDVNSDLLHYGRLKHIKLDYAWIALIIVYAHMIRMRKRLYILFF